MNSSPATPQQSQGFAAMAPPEGSGVMRVDSLPEVMRTERPRLPPRGLYPQKCAPLKDAIAYYASTSVYHVEDGGGWKSGGTRALFHSTDYSYSWIRGPNKAVLLAFPLADYRRYPRLVIDTTLPVRGLYFPQLFSEPYYQGLCQVSQVLFYKHDAIYIPFTAGNFQENTQCLDANSVGGHGGPPYHQISHANFGPYHAWMDAHISKNEGIEYVFKPADENTLQGIIKTLVGSALNLIPFVGPLASISWFLIFDAITDPDKMRELGNLTGVETDILKMQLKEIAKLVKGLKNRKGHWDVGDDDDILRDLEKKAVEEALVEEDREANEHALPVDQPAGAIVFATNQRV
ncbi:hypothetical protein F53441_11363 [Fusarium austroafricanum]|uniref:Uncharacterized protein n=1 Tax=Fusarium austroafricanum TaxID=2364996 RepID=A0A8H4NQD5_9HYPO|nr:hypothetical protein F53441_11363 [Fusarium austroafricanum]